MRPFIIYALPRSRTAWMAQFLSYGDWTCHHEVAILMREVLDIPGLFAPGRVGAVETAAAQGWHLIDHYVPGIRSVVVRRPTDDVVRSMMAVDLRGVAVYDEARLRRIMAYGNRMLDQISARQGVLTLSFDDLGTEAGCARLFEFCLPYKFDLAWWLKQRGENVQVSVADMIEYYHANRQAIDGFKRACKLDLIRLRRNGQITKRAA